MTTYPSTLPSRRQLWICWLILMSMTAVSLVAGDPTDDRRLPFLWVVILLAAAAIKARQILWVFLNLRQSTTTWKATLAAFLATIIVIVLACAGVSALAK
ncbi:cytochrome C oxidase subunit IV family protein [Telmatospirillum sp.]|uniref:cytochrome C oxidase subunit IV family protein n=1 Tax=Telmatospirillum sp. TaxID=2079197 RepID=UPI00284A2893|nr:cytochrome C oxidase subunit IV family protein [Telmatospirillum sp.]MDR3435119.1 cytochrome C oxidase subunit IV family protein [Telmatospirillum sp.]